MDYGAMPGKLETNPNRRSAAYKKQTRFKGSFNSPFSKDLFLFSIHQN